MKKAAIYSFFESYNIGDVLIAQQVEKIFLPYFECKFFDIGSGKPSNECKLKQIEQGNKQKASAKRTILKIPVLKDVITSFLFYRSKKYLKIAQAGSDSDIAIFAGGNIIMELSKLPTGILTLYHTVKYLKRQNKKVCFCFCGVGPFASAIDKKIAKKIIEYADYISVRDEYSRSCVEMLVPQKPVELWPDPVISYSPLKNELCQEKGIGINVYFGSEQKNRVKMRDAYVMCIKQIQNKYPQKNIYLFSSELTDKDDINSVLSEFKGNSSIIKSKINSSEDLFDFYAKVEVIVAARMHTLITAIISQIPVVSVAWQGKVASVMELLNLKEFNFSVKTFITKTEKITDAVDKCFLEKEKYLKKTKETILNIKEDIPQKIKNFALYLEE